MFPFSYRLARTMSAPWTRTLPALLLLLTAVCMGKCPRALPARQVFPPRITALGSGLSSERRCYEDVDSVIYEVGCCGLSNNGCRWEGRLLLNEGLGEPSAVALHLTLRLEPWWDGCLRVTGHRRVTGRRASTAARPICTLARPAWCCGEACGTCLPWAGHPHASRLQGRATRRGVLEEVVFARLGLEVSGTPCDGAGMGSAEPRGRRQLPSDRLLAASDLWVSELTLGHQPAQH